jgi:hypothetical protein
MKVIGVSWAGVSLALLAGASAGQEPGEAERPPAAAGLKVEMVVSRLSGGKKVGSLAYTFPCNTRGRKTVYKSGVEVPVPVRKGEAVEFQYRNVGANIECESSAVAGGRFGLRIALEQSSLAGAGGKTPDSERPLGDVGAHPPLFRTSMADFTVLLRDGQTAQAITGTDPATGEVSAVDVTLEVLK